MLPTREERLQEIKDRAIQTAREIENRVSKFNFLSNTNNFADKVADISIDEILDYTLIHYVSRFYYSPKGDTTIDKEGKEKQNLYISNIILNDTSEELISFYKNGIKVEFFGKTDFSFKELNDLSFKTNGLNKKIINYGVIDGKIATVESSYTSERQLKSHIYYNGYNTVDMKGVARAGKYHTYNVIGFKNSMNQKILLEEERNEYLFKVFDMVDEVNNKLQVIKEKEQEELIQENHTFDFSVISDATPSKEETKEIPKQDITEEVKEDKSINYTFPQTQTEGIDFGVNP